MPVVKPLRDSQRSRLYQAEREAFADIGWHQTIPNHQIQAFVAGVLSKRAVRSRWGARHITVTLKRGGRALSHGALRISLPAGGRNEWVVCHEVAHSLNASDGAPHGPEFAGIYLLLVRTVMGPEAEARLRAAFKTHRVRVNRKGIPEVQSVLAPPHPLGVAATKAARKAPVKAKAVKPRRPGKAAALKAASRLGVTVADEGGSQWDGYRIEACTPLGWHFAMSGYHYDYGHGDSRADAWASMASVLSEESLERCDADCECGVGEGA